MIDIRPAIDADSAFIWRLSMSPEVREMSTRGDQFSFEEHDAWFKEKLANGLNRIWVMEVNGIPVGMIRYGLVVDE